MKLVNISEKYGDPVEVTIEDYEELNPEGTFFYNLKGEIWERLSDTPGDMEQVATFVNLEE